MGGGKIRKTQEIAKFSNAINAAIIGSLKEDNQWLEGDLASEFSAIVINIILTADRLF